MIYGIIYYIIFLVLLSLLFWAIEDNTINKFGTKMVEIDGQQYMVPDFTAFEGDPKMIKSIGSKLTCDTLSNITGQNIKINRSVQGSRSMLSGNPLKSDCTDMANNIMVDYKPREYYTYEGQNHINKNVYEFYNRLALDALKKDSIKNMGYDYIEIPYTVDKCENQNGNLKCYKHVDEDIRRKRIRNYLKQRLLEVLK